jgi:hypothetical protein
MASPIDGFFREWEIDHYHARLYLSEDDAKPLGLRGQPRASLWIANGFSFFKDDSGHPPFLTGMSMWQRWLLWRELVRERRRRARRRAAEVMEQAQRNREAIIKASR